MTKRVETRLVAFRCLGSSDDRFYDTLRSLETQVPDSRLEIAVLKDASALSAEEHLLLASLVDHTLLHKVPQGLGRTNRLAIAQSRINDVDALVIIDGDSIYVDPVRAVSAAIRALDKFNVVVSRQSLVTLPIADRPGEDRLIYEHFERWLLERRFEGTLPEQLQPGLYALDRQAIATIELTCHHFAADWEIAYRALDGGLSLGATEEIAETRAQVSTSFREQHQREKFAELFGVLELHRGGIEALIDEFQGDNHVEYDPHQFEKLVDLCVAAF